ncbi:hypothetical protein ABW19_dt0201038 [Dactylella cylindrospora]|nr:hypothetical protein ABW19_dt0201038 [Dactylella cylindrospora]
MALVAYSDSEESDTESPASAPVLPPPKPAGKSSLSSFLPPPSKKRKLVDDTPVPSTGPRKIKVDLPKITPDESNEESSSSRRKIGKSGGGGMLSFLPAPKRTGVEAVKVAQAAQEEEKKQKAPDSDSSLGAPKAAPRMLGGGMKKVEYAGTAMDTNPTAEDEPEAEPTPIAVEVKPPPPAKPSGPIQGRAIQPFFKKAAPKKASSANATNGAKKEEKKVSLFSLGSALNDSPHPNVSKTAPGEYKPLLVDESPAPAVEDVAPVGDAYQQMEYTEVSAAPVQGPQTFQSISEEIGMDEASMRMFMGRRGRNAEIKLMDFNVDEEYERNERARAAGELAPEKAVVRSIKPGKHSLSSLVNAAQSQRTALEESFAEGRRNKKEAGSKYGW